MNPPEIVPVEEFGARQAGAEIPHPDPTVQSGQLSTKSAVVDKPTPEDLKKRARDAIARDWQRLERGEEVDKRVADITVKFKLFVPFAANIKQFAIGAKQKFTDIATRLDRHSARQSQLERRVKKAERQYFGVWDNGKVFHEGDMVTDNGSLWCCMVDMTFDRPKGSTHWALSVKHGNKGDPGPMGKIPMHRWVDETKLQFQQGPDGATWSAPVQLRGPEGAPGRAVPMGGGGTTTIVNPSSWTPSGW